MSLALLALLGWGVAFNSQDLPFQDEGLIGHFGQLLIFGQVPLILLGFVSNLRRLRKALLLAALQFASLALLIGLIVRSDTYARDQVRARIEAARPLPGSSRAAQAFLAAMAEHHLTDPTYSIAVHNFLVRYGNVLADEISSLGAVQSIDFIGVDNIGWDIYAVAFDKGVRHLHLFLTADSRLLGIALVDASLGCLSSEVYDCRYLYRPFR
jgi:hypothetical protein